MPDEIVTKKLSADMSKGKWRPHCEVCGRFIGVGGLYGNDGYEVEEVLCKTHYEKRYGRVAGETRSE